MPKKKDQKKMVDAETQTDIDMKNMKVKEDTTVKGKRVYRVDVNPHNKLMYHKGCFQLCFD